ncbi:MAG: DUF4012 domain-containing protein [Microbacterium sp.]|uniref:DUF4012 domain-containing protein n=1 Tax=Microbacterium sp. TaxID=51671 RepID=UPI0039E37929
MTRRTRRLLVAVGAGVVLLAAAATCWVLVRAWQAAQELQAAAPLVQQIAGAGDLDADTASLETAQQHLDRAAELTDTPLWRVVELVPGLGPNLAAIRTVSQSAADTVDAIMPPAQALLATGASPDLAAWRAQQEPLAHAAEVFAQARDDIRAIDTGELIPPLADGVRTLAGVADEATPVIDALATAAVVVPGLAGVDGPRDILVVLQNPAELRTGGGITGTFAEIRVEDGAFTLVRQADSTQFPTASEDVAPVSDADTALYGDVVGRFVQNTTMTADFAASAQLALSWWERQFGDAPDAVIAVDPIVLQALLSATGPIALADGSELTADDVVQRLLVDPYLYLDGDGQSALQREVIAAVLPALAARIDTVTWAAALSQPISEGRISVWSSREQEEQAISGTAVAGPLARLDAAGDAGFGVFLDDATGGKMDMYLDVSVRARHVCDGTTVVTVTLTHTGEVQAVADLPAAVTGGGIWGTAVGDIGTTVVVMAPAGSGFGAVTGNGGRMPSVQAIAQGHPATAVRVNISPGQTESVEVRFTATDAQTPVIVSTPTVAGVDVAVEPAACG